MSSGSAVFHKLVEGEGDLVGLIAYGYYKRHKCEFCQKFEEEHQRAPTPEELACFAQTITPTQIDNYHHRATQLLRVFAEESAGELIESETKSIKDDAKAKFDSDIKRLKGNGFWYGVAQGLVASLMFVLAVGIIYFFVAATKVDVLGAIQRWVDGVVREQPAQQPVPVPIPQDAPLPKHPEE